MGKPTSKTDLGALLDRVIENAGKAIGERIAIDQKRDLRNIPAIRSLQSEITSMYILLGLLYPPFDRHGREAFFALLETATEDEGPPAHEQFDQFRSDFHTELGIDWQSVGNEFAEKLGRECSELGLEAERVEMVKTVAVERFSILAEPMTEFSDTAARFCAALKTTSGWKESQEISNHQIRAAILSRIPSLRHAITNLAKSLKEMAKRQDGKVPTSAQGGPRVSVDNAFRTELIRVLVDEGLPPKTIANVLIGLREETIGNEPTSPEAVKEYCNRVLDRSQRRRKRKTAETRRQPRSK